MGDTIKKETKKNTEQVFSVLKPIQHKGKLYGVKDKITLSNPKQIELLTNSKTIR